METIRKHDNFSPNHKNYNFRACDWFKNVLFSTNSFACQVVIGHFVIG